MSAHSPIGASSYYRWSTCPGSVKLSRGIESRSSIYAEEGTRAHEVAAYVLTHFKWPEGLSEEVKDAVLVYVNAVGREGSSHSVMLVEHRFDLSQIHPNLFGTADCVLYNPKKKLLQVFDYKHGSGIPVEVVEDGVGNPQLMYYGLGALLTTGFAVDEVELIIVQPRCNHPEGPVRRFKFSAIELLDFASELKEAALRTEDSNAPLVAGGHCRFCPAAGICPEIHKKAAIMAREEFSPRFSYDPEKLTQALEWLPALEGWIHQVREFAYGEALHGRVPPGYKLVPKRPFRKWRNEVALAGNLMKEFGLTESQIFNRVLKSPAQMEKILPKEVRSKLGEMVTSESSGSVLAPLDDPREPVLTSAKCEFTQIRTDDI